MVKDIDSRLAWSYRSKQNYIKSRELSLSTMNMPSLSTNLGLEFTIACASLLKEISK